MVIRQELGIVLSPPARYLVCLEHDLCGEARYPIDADVDKREFLMCL